MRHDDTSATTATGSVGRGLRVRFLGRLLIGALLDAVLILPILLSGLVIPVSRGPARAVTRMLGRKLDHVEQAGPTSRPRLLPPDPRLLRYLVVQLVLGCLAAAVAALVVMGLVVTFQVSIGAATGGPVPVFGSGPGMVTGRTVALFVLPGLVLAFLAVSGLAGISVLDRLWWDRCCRPSAGELTREVDRLHGTLEEVVHAVDQERRRIERDIHDGIQQQVVALAILLARVDRERDAQERQELLERSRTMTQQVLDELRAVSLRTFPASLDRDGLVSALEALCDRTTVPTDLLLTAVPESDPGTRTATPQAAETAAYFVASEAVTNALKHADCGRLRLEVTQSAAELRISIEDDGTGGADPGGPGLAGIRSRVASQGGRLEVSSPIGGPTRISAVIPCA